MSDPDPTSHEQRPNYFLSNVLTEIVTMLRNRIDPDERSAEWDDLYDAVKRTASAIRLTPEQIDELVASRTTGRSPGPR